MHPQEAAFVERVAADPEEDGPRLVFADWLDERGDPRGEFIRVQVALARLPADDPRADALRDREAALLARYHAAWSEPLRGVAGWTEFRRGLVETVNVEARLFLRRSADLFRLAPVRHVRFLDVGTSLDRLLQSPHLARLNAITIYAQHIDERLTRSLVESPHLGGLQSLNIGRNRVGDRGAERLAWSPRFANLTSLDLSDNAVGDPGARAIAGSTNLGKVVSLELRRNELSRFGLGAICGSATLPGLRHLGMALNHVRAPYEWTAPTAGVVVLESLDLSENGLTPDAVTMLTSLPGLGGLTRLDLGHNEVGNVGAARLAAWPAAANLRVLRLVGNRIGDDGARALARSLYFPQLTELDLMDNPVHDRGGYEFLNTANLPRLRRLGIPIQGLTPKMRRALAARYAR